MTELTVNLVTIDTPENALKIANALVERKLAACVNIVPGLTSVYEWKGARCQESELLLVIKSRHELFDELEAAICELHPYSVPEILALGVARGHQPYLNWLLDGTRDPAAQ